MVNRFDISANLLDSVYSVGINGIDDHGVEKRRGGPRGIHDVVLRIKR